MKEYELFAEIQNVLLDLVCNKTDTITVDDATNELIKVFKAAQPSVRRTVRQKENMLSKEEIEALYLCVGVAIGEAGSGTQTDLAIDAIEKLKADQQSVHPTGGTCPVCSGELTASG